MDGSLPERCGELQKPLPAPKRKSFALCLALGLRRGAKCPIGYP
jgi:hypothetical protein